MLKSLHVLVVLSAFAGTSANAQANFTYLTQSGRASASAEYLGRAPVEQTLTAPAAPQANLVLHAVANVQAGVGFADGSASLGVDLLATSISVSASGGGNGYFPDSGSGRGSAQYNLLFDVVVETLVRIRLNNRGGWAHLYSSNGFDYQRTQTHEYLDQIYTLPVGQYVLDLFGSGGFGRRFSGES